ncbi:MAG: SPOR domain-containing protein [Thermodesulfobacteriota bacterium]
MAQYDINLREYWRILHKRKFIVVVTAVVLGVFSTFFAYLRAPTPAYTSACSIKFEKESTVEGLFAKTLSWSAGDDIETQISVIKSYSVFEKVAEKLGLIPQRPKKDDGQLRNNLANIVQGLQARVKVTREGFTNILHIEVTDTDPVFSQKLANTVASTYKELHSEQQMRRTNEAIKYIHEQLRSVREKLKEAEDEFNRFSQQNQLISIDMQSEKLLGRSQALQGDLSRLREDRRELEGILGQLDSFGKSPEGTGRNFHSAKAGSLYQAANDALVALMLKRDTLLEDFTPKHPEVVEINRKIVEGARRMAYLLRLQIKDTENREGELKEELSEADKKTNLLMEKKLEFDRLKRKVDLYNDMTALLERKNQEALIRQAEKPEEITIVKPALLPDAPINPPKTAATGAMGVLIGLVLGLVAAFIVETFDTSLGAIEDVEETLGTQVVGVIPYVDPKDIYESQGGRSPEKGRESSFLQTAHLVSHFAPKSMIAESFRALRTNIQFKDAERSIKTLAITSASPQEGKTMVSVNLAITMAQAGIKTLLVGSDMRKPMLSRVFGVEMSPGLSDILLGNHPWRDTVKTITDIIMGKMALEEVMMTPGLDNLHIITSGSIPPNPTVLLDSGHLKEFTQEAQKEYDLILFDSAPILSTADAAVLGSKADGVLLVYRAGSISRGLLKRAATQLKQAKCSVLGVILNGMKPEISPDFHDFKYYKYYYSYGEEKKGKPKETSRRLLNFFRDSMGRRGQEQPQAPGEAEGGPGEKPARTRLLTVVLAVIAVACLAAGILWTSGVLAPSGTSRTGPAVAPVQKPQPKPGFTAKTRSAAPIRRPEVKPVEQASPADPSLPPPSRAAPSEARGEVALPPVEKTQGSPVAPETPREFPERPYSLYVGSVNTLEQAKKALSTAGGGGVSFYWAKVDLGDRGIWWRIYAGHFRDPDEAEKFRSVRGLSEATPKQTPYAVLIGVFSDGTEVESRKSLLEGQGLSCYAIQEEDGRSRLLTGAYITKEGAEKEAGELRQKGIECRVVRR